MNQAVAAAKEAFPKWANLPMKERARLMRRLGELIDQNVPEIATMWKPPTPACLFTRLKMC
nr:5-carboxymethyl-2-hydroxymuconate semialdehyde dehydrogenase [Salmonella sp. NCTC 7297]